MKQQEAQHLLASVDELSAKQLGDALTSYDVKSPDTKNDISAPFPFNLMFKTSIGPKGDQVGYLRPETAQGLFVNFRCESDLPSLRGWFWMHAAPQQVLEQARCTGMKSSRIIILLVPLRDVI